MSAARDGREMKQRGRFNADGTFELTGMAGWDNHVLSGRAAVIDGKRSIVELCIRPVEGTDPVALTGVRLRTLPLTEIATHVFANLRMTMMTEEERAAGRVLSKGKGAQPHDSRAATSVEEVVAAYRRAVQLGDAPRKAVTKSLNISPRTADRYIRRARDAGLLPPGRNDDSPTERKSGEQ